MQQKLTLDSEILKPMHDGLEILLNRLMNIVITDSREAEINLKISLDSQKHGEVNKNGEYIEWEEPRISYQLSEKIKEYKNTSKGELGSDYEVKVDEHTGNVFVQKINEQTSLFGGKNND